MTGLTSPTLAARSRIKPIAVFKPLAWQLAPWRDTSPVMLLTGSAGGGKSRLAAEKVHGFCLRYPGATALAIRKTRQSMVNSTVLFLERKIIGRDPRVQHFSSKHRFEYWNGSILAYGGMADDEQREQVRSIGQDGGVDIIWKEEANQFEENDYNELIARNRAKAGGFRQIILSTNPDSPLHWIYRRLIVGNEATVYYSHEADNQYNPDDYKTALARMTGLEGQRLREGVWAQATGLVFDTWRDADADSNVTPEADYLPNGGDCYLAVDDGYTGARDVTTGYYTAESHPRVFLWCQLRQDGRLAIFDESYAVHHLAPAHVAEVLGMGYPSPVFAAVDKAAAQLRGLLHADFNIYTRGGPSSVDESIKELREWISPDANGVRRLIVHPRCKQLRAEFAAYRYDPHNEKGDKVIKQFDHGCLVAGTLIETSTGRRSIESITVGDLVLTRKGYRPVTHSMMTSPNAPIWSVELSNGAILEGTRDHPVFVVNRGFIPIDSLRYGDRIVTTQQGESLCHIPSVSYQRRSISTGSSLGAILIQRIGRIRIIFDRAARTFCEAFKLTTANYGSSITGPSPMATMFTTPTITLSTIPSITLSVSTCTNTNLSMGCQPSRLSGWLTRGLISIVLDIWPPSGRGVQKDSRGIARTASGHGTIVSRLKRIASNAARSIQRVYRVTPNSVQTTANQNIDARQAPIIGKVSARFAVSPTSITDRTRTSIAPLSVRRVYALGTRRAVYNLSVEGEPEYFSNGVLVHNCDAARYLAWTLRHE